ncbi:GNAT family N-acetyltransferase [Paragemmobacter ruber]|uniref:GNAT family N-acetyltransferase n=1 Tax=Paragemmobacter ruber TaxID=1985673 RepID=A0ABW9Y389_9RHOB|nr:GNAT family N-acetyltransferase [Rhodobacter ruber]NBE06985.1 GNAT family N-acetyltransferase [Rhodobacter ruber]
MIRIRQGLPEHLRAEAAVLYWQAFGGKLGRVLGPEDKALEFLRRVMRADHCLTAFNRDDRLVGLAGFKTTRGSFAGGTDADLRAVYGPIGGRWRATVLRLLGNDGDTTRFLLDGLCVSDAARGQGVGTLLLEAIVAEGRARGYRAVRLDVVDTNDRARALYERRGFVIDRTEGIGPLRLIFGFRAAHSMVRPI